MSQTSAEAGRPKGAGAGHPGSTAWDRSPEGQRHHLTSWQGIPALCLDALSSVAYGPQAVAVVLLGAGLAATRYTLPIVLVIVVMLAVLVSSYTQVIRVASDGGGSYAVAKLLLGPQVSQLAAASLVVDYVLTVAVSLSAGAQALSSAFPGLQSHELLICLAGLLLLTVLNLGGISESARVLVVPTVVFLLAIYATVVSDLVRSHPAATLAGPALAPGVGTLGVLLILKAFSNGCSALTGIEAIANGTPAFREPRVARAQRTELALGLLLGTMLLGLGFAYHHFHLPLKGNVTLVAQLAAAGLGKGAAFYVTQIAVAVVLGVAANTSFGGLPVLLSLLARDNRMPHVFALRAQRPVYRYGVVALAVLAGLLLVARNADTNSLIPLYGVGVFTGFTISQVGLVRHWLGERPRGWWRSMGLNAFGAGLSGVACGVLVVTKFTAGAWVAVVTIALLMLLFGRISAYYGLAARAIGIGTLPALPAIRPSVVLVPVSSITKMTANVLAAAQAMGDEVRAVSVQYSEEDAGRLRADWERWSPGVPLVTLVDERHSLVGPLVRYVADEEDGGRRQVTVLISELTPDKRRHALLHNQRGKIITTLLRQRTDAVIATLAFRIHD